MLEQYCGWTREVDWGSAPAWAAVIIAAIGGGFAAVNANTAVKSFRENVISREVAQARKVYSTIGKLRLLKQGDPLQRRANQNNGMLTFGVNENAPL